MAEGGSTFESIFHASRRAGEKDYVEARAGMYVADFIRMEKGWVTQDQLALRYARAEYRAQFAGNIDRLTGAFNRNYAEGYLDARISEGKPFPVVFIDIDDFGQYNKSFGHHAGDGILRDFCHLADEVLDPTDLLARYGGEEFILALPESTVEVSVDRLVTLGERVRDELGRMEALDGVREITISVGLTQWVPGQTRDVVIAQANDLERSVKEKGKNGLVYVHDGVQVARVFGE